ncbi:transglutaminase-like domain-containing protein [Archaeoglobus sp.]
MERALIVLAILGVILLVNFVEKVDFSRTNLEGIVWSGENIERPASVSNASLVQSNFNNLSSNSNPPKVPIYFVEGYNASYMRTAVYNVYRNGVWYEKHSYNDYQGFGGKIYKVTPIVPFEGHIPVYKGTVMVTIKSGYNASSGTFQVSKVDRSYYGFVKAENIKPTVFAKDGHSTVEVPCLDRIRKLTLRIVENASSDYEKVKRIEEYLKKNYRYSFDYSPKGDPICWFLFEGKRGICKHFASAFVVMCESIGIPARVVVGYRVKPTEENQTVFGDQAHMWAEVKFKEGWVEFDPTPLNLAKKIPTHVEVTKVDGKIVEGENFSVEGVVKCENGSVEDGFVEVYLKKTKSEKGILLGLVKVVDGKFKAVFKAPNVTGRYYVVAHFVGSLKYGESWSDPIVEIFEKPDLIVKLPDKVPRGYVVEGELRCRDLPADVNVYVDGKPYRVLKTDEKGNFKFELDLPCGLHEIEILYKGGNYTLPVEIKKEVEVGNIDVFVSNYTVIAGRDNEIEVCAFFNEKPVNFSVNGRTYRCNETLMIKPDRIGFINLSIDVLGFKENVTLKSVAKTIIEYRFVGNKTVILVRDNLGNPLNGTLYVNGKPYELKNGYVEVPCDRGVAFYPGDEFHLPSEVKLKRTELPMYLLAIPTFAFVGYVAYRVYCRLDVRFLKEFEDLPNIWRVGEAVRFEVRSFREWKVNGVKTNKLTFDKAGDYDLVFENGKVRKIFRVKIVEDYGDAIAEIFKEVCDDFKTVREVFGDRRCVRIFEDYVYGGRRGYTREDFIRVFKELKSSP